VGSPYPHWAALHPVLWVLGMGDIILLISVGVKNDGLTQEAGQATLSAMIQERVEATVMELPWVTDMLVTTAQSGEEV
jgi:hypothetical protein